MSDMPSDMPDFDSMSPEEMMAWMETLAKRQGADAETLTTSADAQVADVSEDDERLKDMGEYIPHGWSKEKWEEHLAKEEAEKAAKQASQPPAEPTPPPAPSVEPAPVAMSADTPVDTPADASVGDASGDGDMPDFDAMSPEEMMAWMETLAKRQGADASQLTTSADAQVADVSEDDERLKDVGEYVPYGWKKEDWDAHLAKEAEAKAAQQASQPPIETTPPVEPTPPAMPVAATPPPETPTETPSMPTLEGFDLDADTQPAASLDDAMSALSDIGSGGDDGNPMDWLAGLATDADDEDTAALANLADIGLDDPLAGLANLAGDADGDPLAGLNVDAGSGGDDPMDWLSGLATDADDDQAVDTGVDEDVDPVEWMESLSRRQGAPDEELTTAANLDVPIPTDFTPDGPGYGEDYSFENPPNELQDSDNVPIADFNSIEEQLEDPSNWLDSLAAGVGQQEDEDELTSAVDESDIMDALNTGADVTPEQMQAFFEKQFDKAEQFSDDDDVVDEDAPPLPAEIPDWLQERMNASPSDGDATLDDVPVDDAQADEFLATLNLEDDESDATAVPDWLGEAETDDTNVLDAGVLDVDDASDSLDDSDMPAWLVADMDEDEDISDIFADDSLILDDTGDASADSVVDDAQEMPATLTTDEIEVDTSDPWVQALAIEHDAESVQEMEDWYADSVKALEGGGAVAQSLQPADLPDEESLPMGQPRSVPDWLEAESAPMGADVTSEIAGLGDNDGDGVPDWLQDDYGVETSDDMPDWLRDQVDDSIADESDVPDWLSDVEADVVVDEIPDWLRETLDDEGDDVAVITDSTSDAVPVVPTPSPTPTQAPVPVAKSPAPLAPIDPNLDVAATLQQARDALQSGDVDGALVAYENVIRANQALDTVAQDTGKLLADAKHKQNPAIYRIHGDVLMRQGKLQDALDTYRRALNLL
jgi:hypothetical protein